MIKPRGNQYLDPVFSQTWPNTGSPELSITTATSLSIRVSKLSLLVRDIESQGYHPHLGAYYKIVQPHRSQVNMGSFMYSTMSWTVSSLIGLQTSRPLCGVELKIPSIISKSSTSSNRAGNTSSSNNSSRNLHGTMIKMKKASISLVQLATLTSLYTPLQAPHLKMRGKIRTGLRSTRRKSGFVVF